MQACWQATFRFCGGQGPRYSLKSPALSTQYCLSHRASCFRRRRTCTVFAYRQTATAHSVLDERQEIADNHAAFIPQTHGTQGSEQRTTGERRREEEADHSSNQITLFLSLSVTLITLPWLRSHPEALLVPVALLALPVPGSALRPAVGEGLMLLLGGIKWMLAQKGAATTARHGTARHGSSLSTSSSGASQPGTPGQYTSYGRHTSNRQPHVEASDQRSYYDPQPTHGSLHPSTSSWDSNASVWDIGDTGHYRPISPLHSIDWPTGESDMRGNNPDSSYQPHAHGHQEYHQSHHGYERTQQPAELADLQHQQSQHQHSQHHHHHHHQHSNLSESDFQGPYSAWPRPHSPSHQQPHVQHQQYYQQQQHQAASHEHKEQQDHSVATQYRSVMQDSQQVEVDDQPGWVAPLLMVVPWLRSWGGFM